MKVAFTTLGCKLNFAETSTYRRDFIARGADVVPWSEPADVYVINTCAVTETAEKKSRNLIRRAHKTSPEARIAVTGCYAELRRDELLALPGVAFVFGASEKSQLVDTVSIAAEEAEGPVRYAPSELSFPSKLGPLPLTRPRAAMPAGPSASSAYTEAPAADILPAYSSGDRTRSFLKVQDGCDNFCAYCTVPYARGRSRNIPICEAVREAKIIAEKGVKEIVLTGVNTGDFGRTTGESFLDLLKALNEVEGIERYRISSIEPNLLTEEIIDWIASGTKFQKHFHIPLQTGCDELLRKVNRHYDTALFASRIDYIRSKMERPGESKVFFGIDVIAGLPGETDEMFRETYHFLKERIHPAFLHVFHYSRRPGTRAAVMPDQVRDSVKTERVAELDKLCGELHEEFVRKHRGMKETVLWESARKDGKMGGYTGNYIRVERPWDPERAGKLEEIEI